MTTKCAPAGSVAGCLVPGLVAAERQNQRLQARVRRQARKNVPYLHHYWSRLRRHGCRWCLPSASDSDPFRWQYLCQSASQANGDWHSRLDVVAVALVLPSLPSPENDSSLLMTRYQSHLFLAGRVPTAYRTYLTVDVYLGVHRQVGSYLPYSRSTSALWQDSGPGGTWGKTLFAFFLKACLAMMLLVISVPNTVWSRWPRPARSCAPVARLGALNGAGTAIHRALLAGLPGGRSRHHLAGSLARAATPREPSGSATVRN